ncbi:glycine oxidase ThiO [Kangiella sediminilitoris]|uniref:FAD dependent oxidoreductase n=1 Tax=Kangiella sediminilitoris TaxID=1144748 RepID=A0A1B3B7N5_9GAMM|nr:glycine oxidase ThiO [Kangiella sediminilitoris]AOE48802.1 FAD dependent oxidoreductase [Kangiella sediminilitoris]
MKVAVVGAGIAGRFVAWRLVKSGYSVELFDKAEKDEESACSFAAAGILSPLAELEMAEADIFRYGLRSMSLYQEWLPELTQPVFFRQIGSLVTAHGSDKIELDHFYRLIQRKVDQDDLQQNPVEKVQVSSIEPDLEHLGEGLYLPSEGQIDPIGLMAALASELEQSEAVNWHHNTMVEEVMGGAVTVAGNTINFDWTFDCRGLGAKDDLPLRAVRGELLWLQAPDVSLEHLTRLIHPRYRIYVVPRPDNIYLIGATEIESEDYSSVSVRSSLELLSAAYSVHRGFGEARIIKSVVNCRPALPDNLPTIETDQGLTRINGLYRHGILMAPAVVEQALEDFAQNIPKVTHANYS